MPDPKDILKERADLLEVDRDIVRELKNITKLQERELKQAQKLGIHGKLLESIKERHITLEEKLLLTNESIVRKQAEWNKHEANRKTLGTPMIETQRRLGDQIRKATKYQASMSNELARSHGVATLLERAGLGRLVAASEELALIWKAHPMLGVLTVLIGLGKKIFDVFKELDTAAEKFRMTMGTTRDYTKAIQKTVVSLATSLANVGVTADGVYSSFISVAKTIGTTQAASEGMVKDISLLNAQLGISHQISSDFLRTMGMAGKSTMDSERNMLLFTTKMAQAAGIPLADVLEDVVNATKTAYSLMTRSPLALVKAAVEAKRMGTTLSSAAASAQSLLKFSSSVVAEMEASVLLGQSLNLQRARELSYRRDLDGLNKEILKQAKAINFEQLDAFQQESVAKAFGKSAEELGKMLQADRERQSIDRAIAKDANLRKQRQELDKMLSTSRSLADSDAERARILLETEANQSRLTSISNSWKKIMMEMSRVFLPAIDVALKFVADNLKSIVNMTVPFFVLWQLASKIGSKFIIVGSVFAKMGKFFGTIFSKIPLIGKPILALAGAFSKWIPIIGWIITAVTVLVGFFKRLGDISKSFREKGVWGGLLEGLKAIGSALYDALIKPFVDVWDWLKKTFFGQSPSELGLLIVRGIEAVEQMLIGALLSPFRTAWALIKKIPFVSKMFDGADIQPNVPTDITVDRPTANAAGTGGGVFAAVQDSTAMKLLLDKLDSLNDNILNMRNDFKNGGIMATVSLDGQKVDAVLARTRLFRGELSPS